MNLLPNSCQQMAKKSENGKKTAPPTNPAIAPRRKFRSLLRYHLLIGVNVMRVKNITVTVSVRVSVMVSVSLVFFYLFALLCRLGLVLWFGSV